MNYEFAPMKTVAIVQARMGSTRLSQKMIRKICGKTLLEHILERLRFCTRVNTFIVATTTLPEDKRIIQIAQQQEVAYFAGSAEDVLTRFLQAAETYQAETIVRICGDNPLIDPKEVDRVVQNFLQTKCDYATNTLDDGTLLILTGLGLAVEVFTLTALKKADEWATDPYYREHVTPYFYEHPEQFDVRFFPIANSLHLKKLRLTVDTEEDFQIVSEICQHLYVPGSIISMGDVLRYLNDHPYLYEKMEAINKKYRKGR